MAQLETKFIKDDAVTNAKIKLANAGWLRARNAANSADINILEVDGSDVIQFASVPQVPSMAVSNADLSNKQYVDQVVSNLLDKARVESFTLSGGDITNGYIDLADLAFTDSVYLDAGGVGQVQGTDYSLSTVGGVTRVTFLTPLSSLLVAGDEITVSYNISASIVNTGPVYVNLLKEVAVINDTKAQGTDGGSASGGGWHARDLNTIQSSQPWLSLSSNQFTLDPGTYEIDATVPGLNVNHHKAKLYDVTNSADAIMGSAELSEPAGQPAQSQSKIIGTVVVSAATTYEVQHQVQTTAVGIGFGAGSNFTGAAEVFTQVKISKLNPAPQTFFASSIVNSISTGVTGGTFTTFTTSPALSFTPNVSGTYKVYSSAAVYQQGASNEGAIRIFNTSGGATLLFESQAEIFGTGDSGLIATIMAQSVYTLTAGVAYVFDIQGKNTGGTIYIRGGISDFYMFAEKVG